MVGACWHAEEEPMLSLGAERAGDLPRILRSRGGFACWYADLIDDRGNGLVLIWAFGLPFLPEARRAVLPAARPCVSLAVYEARRPRFYLLQTYPAEAARLEAPGLLRLGGSSFRLQCHEGTAKLDVDLDLPIPDGGRVTGKLQARGARCRSPGGGDATHRWSPILAAATGGARLLLGRAAFELSGRAYADSNGS